MRIYCMSDIHGCMAEFEDALSLVRHTRCQVQMNER